MMRYFIRMKCVFLMLFSFTDFSEKIVAIRNVVKVLKMKYTTIVKFTEDLIKISPASTVSLVIYK